MPTTSRSSNEALVCWIKCSITGMLPPHAAYAMAVARRFGSASSTSTKAPSFSNSLATPKWPCLQAMCRGGTPSPSKVVSSSSFANGGRLRRSSLAVSAALPVLTASSSAVRSLDIDSPSFCKESIFSPSFARLLDIQNNTNKTPRAGRNAGKEGGGCKRRRGE